MPHIVAAYCTDLIFQSKITATARAAGTPLQIAGSIARLTDLLTDNSITTLLIDLNAAGDPLQAIALARAKAAPPRTLCFVSHVQTDLATAARNAGADEVMPRSAFVMRLPDILANK